MSAIAVAGIILTPGVLDVLLSSLIVPCAGGFHTSNIDDRSRSPPRGTLESLR